MQFLNDLIDLIHISIKEDAENNITAGNIIQDGFSQEIDEQRKLVSQGHLWISEYQQKMILETGISTLKIKFTNNFGYFIEISKNHVSKIPDFFIQRQSLLQAYRYSTAELQDFEKKIFDAQTTLGQKEYEEFLNIRNSILGHFHYLYELGTKVSYIDYISNGAYISLYRHYNTPELGESYDVTITGGKHPVLSMQEKDFIANDLHFTKKEYIHIITGPNMGGKSTFLRQNALLILMAHMGYDIPCQKAVIGKTDKIFSRVGAGDNIYLGQSTFMVEMQEVAFILRNATKKSFIIIDEVGRGTSTYDGMGLAWSILQYIHEDIKAKTLFATHYHEIIDHAKILGGVKNYSVAVGENNENIVFLRKIIPGGMKKSYGIEVAKLAGLPEKVLKDAKNMMQSLEKSTNFHQLSLGELSTIPSEKVENNEKYTSIIEQIIDLNINLVTPLEMLSIFSQIQEQVKKIK